MDNAGRSRLALRGRGASFLRRLRAHAWLREKRAITLLVLLSCVFLIITALVRWTPLLEVDWPVTMAVQRHRSGLLDALAGAATYLGNTAPLLVTAFAGAVLLLALRKRWAALLCLATGLGLPLNMILKLLVDRARPDPQMVAVIQPVGGLSFPSGHAMVSVLCYGFLAVMAWVHIEERRRRILIVASLALLAFCIGVSRVYLGAHWFSDVAGGWTAGLFFLLLWTQLYRRVGKDELGRPPVVPPAAER